MQTHRDSDFPFPPKPTERPPTGSERREARRIEELQHLAQEMRERGESSITGGKPTEMVLAEVVVDGVMMRRLPDDPDCLRISIGNALHPDSADTSYVVFRGDPMAVLMQLERATILLRRQMARFVR